MVRTLKFTSRKCCYSIVVTNYMKPFFFLITGQILNWLMLKPLMPICCNLKLKAKGYWELMENLWMTRQDDYYDNAKRWVEFISNLRRALKIWRKKITIFQVDDRQGLLSCKDYLTDKMADVFCGSNSNFFFIQKKYNSSCENEKEMNFCWFCQISKKFTENKTPLKVDPLENMF